MEVDKGKLEQFQYLCRTCLHQSAITDDQILGLQILVNMQGTEPLRGANVN